MVNIKYFYVNCLDVLHLTVLLLFRSNCYDEIRLHCVRSNGWTGYCTETHSQLFPENLCLILLVVLLFYAQKIGPKMLDQEGKEVPGNRGYK